MIFPAGVVNPLDHVPLSKSILVLKEGQLKRALEETDKSPATISDPPAIIGGQRGYGKNLVWNDASDLIWLHFELRLVYNCY